MLNMFAWAANQVLGVFSHLTEEGSRITGATYTTVNATIPVTFIMAAITAILGVILGLWIMKSHTLEGSAPIAHVLPKRSRRGRCRPWPSPPPSW